MGRAVVKNRSGFGRISILPLRRGLVKSMTPDAPPVRRERSDIECKAGWVKWLYANERAMTLAQIAKQVGEPYGFVRNIIELNYHAKAPMLRPPGVTKP